MLLKQLEALLFDAKTDIERISNLANASSFLYSSLDNISWIGFYLLENDELKLGPFMGHPACTNIKLGKGVCGTSFLNNEVLVVDDVHQFSGHIACDKNSNSEIVIPLSFGVMDVDSYLFSRFKEDKDFFIAVCKIIEEKNKG